MRVTETRMLNQAAYSLERERANVAKAGEELSSGVRVNRPSDDPAAWAEGVRARARRTHSDASGTAMSRARGQLLEADSVLSSVGEGLRGGLEDALQFANGTYNATDRANAAVTIQTLKAQLLDAANTKGSDGEYLFGGSDRTSAPFDAAGNYTDDNVRRSIGLSPSGVEQVTLSGDVFADPTGVNIFSVLDAFATALQNNDQAGLQNVVTEMGLASEQVAWARGQAGVRVAGLDRAEESRVELEISLQETEVRAIGADAVDAALRLAQGQQALEGARTVIQRIVSMLAN